MLFTLLKKGRRGFLMHLYCVVIVILCCPLKEVSLYGNFQLGPGKCPLLGGVRNVQVSL